MRAIYIPNGPKNLQPLFTVNFDDIAEYTVEIVSSFLTVLAVSTTNVIDSCEEDTVRVHFLNSLGAIDAMNFKLITKEHAPTSESTERPLVYPLVKSRHAGGRFNVKANDTLQLTSIEYDEDQMEWITELLDSPLAWMQWKGTQGQADSYLPVVITDTKMQTVKQDERYVYEVTIQCRLSNDRITIRN